MIFIYIPGQGCIYTRACIAQTQLRPFSHFFHLNHTPLSLEHLGMAWGACGNLQNDRKGKGASFSGTTRGNTAFMMHRCKAYSMPWHLIIADITKPMALWIWWLPRLFKKILAHWAHCLGPPEKVLWHLETPAARSAPIHSHQKCNLFCFVRDSHRN